MNNHRKFLVFLGDCLTLFISFVGTILISFPEDFNVQLASHAVPFILLYAVWLLVLYIFNLYDNQNIRIYLGNLSNTLFAFLVALSLGMLMFYLFPIFAISPKTNLLINIGLFTTLFIGWRRIVSGVMAQTMFEKVLILGRSPESEQIKETLSKKNLFGYQCVGIVDSIDEAVLSIKEHKVSKIIFAKHLNTIDLYKITRLGVDTLPLITMYERIYERIPLSLIDDTIAVEILNKEKDIFYNITSRLLSIVVSLIILIVSLPFTIIVTLLILLQDGFPILYTHTRVGEKNKIFTVLKFRSMIKESEKHGAVWAGEKDPRITRVGILLRKTHIDEIPQMINILKGDISLVGPRPERPSFVKELEDEVPYYFMRHIIKPGFTGWAQIKFRYARSKEDSATKLEYDLFYLKNRSIALDFGILLKTIQIIFTH
jgi:exopolysaccharide biosynthesis polyprenyl glycosylphosphotransferase